MAIFAASTVGACSETSRIFWSTKPASSLMYAGSPAARTEYVWPKISTCVTDGLGAIFSRGDRFAPRREDSTRGQARLPGTFVSSSVFRRRSMRVRTAARSASWRARAAAAAPFFSLASRANAGWGWGRAFSGDSLFPSSTSDSSRDSIASSTPSRVVSPADSALPSLRPFVSFTSSSSICDRHAVHRSAGQRQKAPRRRVAPCVHVLAGQRAQRRTEPQGQRRLHESFSHAGATVASFRLHGHELRGRAPTHGRFELLPRGRKRMRHGEIHFTAGEARRRLDGRHRRRQQRAQQVEIEIRHDGIGQIPRGGQRGLENPDPAALTARAPDAGGAPLGEVRREIFFEGERAGGKAEALKQCRGDSRPFEEIGFFGCLRPVATTPPREQDPNPLSFQDSLSSLSILLFLRRVRIPPK